MKNVLVLGSGGREHSIAAKFKESKHINKVHIIPGNDGLKKDFIVKELAVTEYETFFNEVYLYIKENLIDLVFVGNEQFLADGIVNFLNQKGIKVIGPTKEAARIESSKVFSKDLMKKYNIPTAVYESFCDIYKALEFIQTSRFPLVLKADGLAAGKGVLIAETKNEAEDFIKDMLSGKKFGNAGKEIVIEEFLNGEEVSVFAFCDGENFVSTIFSQDHKRAFDNDEGLNTGGMGAFAPVDKFIHLKSKIDNEIFLPVLKAMKQENCPFTGVLYAGLIIDNDDVRVIEFNCRFGDPETQVILPLLENDIYELCELMLNKKIFEAKLEWKQKYAVTIFLASIGYPEKFDKGHEIFIDPNLYSDEKIKLFFAGVKDSGEDNYFLNNGGRVISFTSLDDSLKSTIDYAYSKISLIKSDILRFRKDIGKNGLQ